MPHIPICCGTLVENQNKLFNAYVYKINAIPEIDKCLKFWTQENSHSMFQDCGGEGMVGAGRGYGEINGDGKIL